MPAPPASKLDHTQILKHSFIDSTGELRVSATASIGTVDVVIDAAGGDNIAISDGVNTLDINANGSINVEGPLTNAELRASPVPISAASLPLPTGAATSALQTTTNISLASIDSKLTSPLTTSTKVALTPNAPTFYGATNVSGIAVAANANRKGLVIVNTSTAVVSLSFGANPAILNSGITLNANGGTWVMDEYTFTTQAVNAISNAATRNLSIQEFNT